MHNPQSTPITITDIGELQQLFAVDKYKQMRRIIFYFMNRHDEVSYYAVNPVTLDENTKEDDNDEFLNGDFGPYENILVADYLAFLKTQQGWYEALCMNKDNPPSKEAFLAKASRLSDYSLAKGEIRGGLLRDIYNQFKSNCLKYCDSYYAELDQLGTPSKEELAKLPEDIRKKVPLSKERKLALVLCRFVHLLNTLSGQRNTLYSHLTGTAKVNVGTPKHLDKSPLYHATPRPRDSLESFDLNEGNISATGSFLDMFRGHYLEKDLLAHYKRSVPLIEIRPFNPSENQNKQKITSPSFSPEFWAWDDDILTTIKTIILLLEQFEKHLTTIDDPDALSNVREFRGKLQELQLHCLNVVAKFTPIYIKFFPDYFLPEEILKQRRLKQTSDTKPILIPAKNSGNSLHLPLTKTPPPSPPSSPHIKSGSQPAHSPAGPFARPSTSTKKTTGPSSLRQQVSATELAAATSSAPDLRTTPDSLPPSSATLAKPPAAITTDNNKETLLSPTEKVPSPKTSVQNAASPPAQSASFFSTAIGVLGGFISRRSSEDKFKQTEENLRIKGQKDDKNPEPIKERKKGSWLGSHQSSDESKEDKKSETDKTKKKGSWLGGNRP